MSVISNNKSLRDVAIFHENFTTVCKFKLDNMSAKIASVHSGNLHKQTA